MPKTLFVGCNMSAKNITVCLMEKEGKQVGYQTLPNTLSGPQALAPQDHRGSNGSSSVLQTETSPLLLHQPHLSHILQTLRALEEALKEVDQAIKKESQAFPNALRVHNAEYKPYHETRFKEVTKHQHKRGLGLKARKLVRLVYAILKRGQF